MTEAAKLPKAKGLFIILLLVLLSCAVSGFYLFQKERAKNVALQAELEEIKTKQKITETKLQESQKTAFALEDKLKAAKSQIDVLTGDLEQEKALKLEALTQIGQLKTVLEQQTGLRSDLEERFSQAQEEVKKAQAQLKELQVKKEELEEKIKGLEVKNKEASGVELGRIVVNPEKTSNLEGTVLVINKEYNFIVINLGSKDGVTAEDVFSVYHSDKYLGDIKVEKVHDSMAAAGFSSKELKNKVAEGDKVVRKSK